ncbi:MAG: alpha/beta hydrolase [Propionibacteriales bacterium]|nr:alpha/beta hydrolase [Propionibacteriales bacterium]
MTLVSERIGQFFVDDHRLEYTEFGSGDRWVVLVHGELLPRRMHQPLARKIAAAGTHVITVDLLGHGRSDRPTDPRAYSITAFGEQVIALLDHLGVDRAVLGGTSVGANVCLEAAVLAPERIQGLVLEMPVLDNAVVPGLVALTPVLGVSRVAPVAVSGLRWLSRRVPRGLVPFWFGVGLDALDQRPAALAATLHGVFFGRLAPSSKQRSTIAVPALVVGHAGDPLHPEADAAMLADELGDSTFVRARGPLEWRVRPTRLDEIAVGFVVGCWDQPVSGRLLGASS